MLNLRRPHLVLLDGADALVARAEKKDRSSKN